jgi:hypothetical protein
MGGDQGSTLATGSLQLLVWGVMSVGRVTVRPRLPSLRECCPCEEIVLLLL